MKLGRIFATIILGVIIAAFNFSNCSAEVKLGDTGEEVAEVQRCLIAQNLLSGEADGICGEATVNAIKEFQAALGLTVDGICGEETFNLLRAAAYGELDVTTMMPLSSESSAISSSGVLARGMTGEKVKELQRILIGLGYLSGEADGSYGDETFYAVKKFQAAHGLEADGICGNETFNLLSSAAEIEFESKV